MSLFYRTKVYVRPTILSPGTEKGFNGTRIFIKWLEIWWRHFLHDDKNDANPPPSRVRGELITLLSITSRMVRWLTVVGKEITTSGHASGRSPVAGPTKNARKRLWDRNKLRWQVNKFGQSRQTLSWWQDHQRDLLVRSGGIKCQY